MKQTKVFRVFVSSTFSDFVAERDALQSHTWPALEAFCRSKEADFQAVDLRWGVNQEAALDQRTIPICIEELRRCQRLTPRPNLVVLLGNRYGWRPLPYLVPRDELERILATVRDDGDRRRMLTWYRLDENQVPPVYVLQARTKAFRDSARWMEEEEALRRILLTGAAAAAVGVDRYTLSATHQEILAGALEAFPRENLFGFFRNLQGVPVDDPASRRLYDCGPDGARDVVSASQLDNLKTALRKSFPRRIDDYTVRWRGDGPRRADLEAFCDLVEARLRSSIERELAHLEELDALDEEIEAHQAFGSDRRAIFTGRDDVLGQIAAYLGDRRSPSRPFVLYGEGGSGKSAILAVAASRARERHPEAVVIERYIGATPASVDAVDLCRAIADEISRAFGLSRISETASASDVLAIFARHLTLATDDRPIMIVLDALDQLDSEWLDHALNWLPVRLAPHCRILLSMRASDALIDFENRMHPERGQLPDERVTGPDDTAPAAVTFADDPESVWRSAFEAGEVGEPNPSERLASMASHRLVHADALSRGDGEQALDMILSGASRRLTSRQRTTVLDGFLASGLPLWLKLASEMAKRWPSWFEPAPLPVDLAGLIRILLDRLGAEDQHGSTLVASALALLATAQSGLTEGEMLDLLSRDSAVLAAYRRRAPDSPVTDRLPAVVWSRLHADLEPYLQERVADGTIVYAFFHVELELVVRERFLSGGGDAECRIALADYFDDPADQPVYLDRKSWRPNLRRLTNLPYQLRDDPERFSALLDDLEFPLALAAARRLSELERIYLFGLAVNSDDDRLTDRMREWRRFINQGANVLRRGDVAWPAQRIFLQLASEHADDSPVRLAARRWLRADRCDWPWLCNPVRPRRIERTYCDRVYELPRSGGTRVRVRALFAQTIEEFGAPSTVLVWSNDRNVYAFDDAEGARPIRLPGHIDRQWGVVITEQGTIEPSAGTILGEHKLGVLALQHSAGGPGADLTGVCGCLEIGEGRILTWFHDRVLIVSDLTSGEMLARLEGHGDWVRGAADIGNNRFASWSDDGTIRFWDTRSLKLLRTIRAHADWIVEARVDRHRMVLLTRDDSYAFASWSLVDGAFLDGAKHHGASCDSVVVGEDGSLTVDAGAVPRLPPPEWTQATRGRTADRVIVIDHRRRAFLHHDGEFEIWDQWAHHWLNDCVGHTGPVLGIEPGIFGDFVLSWSDDGSVRRWRLESFDPDWPYGRVDSDGRIVCLPEPEIERIAAERQRARLERHRSTGRHHGPVNGVEILSDREYVSWADDGDVRVWERERGRCRLCFHAHAGPIRGVIAQDDKTLITWSDSGSVYIWDLGDGTKRGAFSPANAKIDAVVSLDSNHLLVGVAGDSIRLWNTDDLTEEAAFRASPHAPPFRGARMLPRRHILCWNHDDAGRSIGFSLWRISDRSLIERFDAGALDGANGVFLWNEFGPIVHWDLDLVQETAHLQTPRGERIVDGLALDRGRLLILRDSGKLGVWDRVGSMLDPVPTAVRSPIRRVRRIDDQWIVTIGDDHAIGFWDAESMRLAMLIPGRSREVRQILPLPDRRFLLVELLGDLRVLDVAKGETIPIGLPEGAATEQAVYLDRSRILLRSLEDQVWLWEIDGTAAAERIDDARRRPYLAKCRGAVRGTDNVFALAFGHAIGIYRIDDGEIVASAEWHSNQAGEGSDRTVTIHAVTPDGSIIVELETGGVFPLKLFQGRHRIVLAELGVPIDDSASREEYG